MRRLAVVAMPRGVRTGHDGTPIDFDRVFAALIRPALEEAGCEVVPPEGEARGGELHLEAFQALLVADLVVADLTLDGTNAWYELGVRHALRARGVVLVQGPRADRPFAACTDRRLCYALRGGAPDPVSLEAARATLAAMAREALTVADAPFASPLYRWLDGLREPPWRHLLLRGRSPSGEAWAAWADDVDAARRKGLPGDLLVLADEAPTRAMALEARRAAGDGLLTLGQPGFALEQFDAALRLEPHDAPSRRQRARCLARLGRFDEAREQARRPAPHDPADAEDLVLAGQLAQERWVAGWRLQVDAELRRHAAAGAGHADLCEALEACRAAFEADPSHVGAGIGALRLAALRQHLHGAGEPGAIDLLLGGVRWAAASALARRPHDRQARAALAEASLLGLDGDAVRRDWQAAVDAADGDWAALDSLRHALQRLLDLGFRPDDTAAAWRLVASALARAAPPFQPRQVLLSSGHMMDAPGRSPPRFPPAQEAAAAARFAQALDEAGVGAGDLALCQAASGSDLLFLEACLTRGVRCQLLLPFPEPQFVERSVLPAQQGARWRERYAAVRARLADSPRVMPVELGPTPRGIDPYERCNLWLLYTALAWGGERVSFYCLWDGQGGDGPGGTAHLHEEVRRRAGRVVWIDTRRL